MQSLFGPVGRRKKVDNPNLPSKGLMEIIRDDKGKIISHRHRKTEDQLLPVYCRECGRNVGFASTPGEAAEVFRTHSFRPHNSEGDE